MKKDNVYEFFRRLEEREPEPKGELDYTNPYTLLVAVALSAQATDIGVNRATKGLFKVVATPQEMLNLGEDKLKKHIKTMKNHRKTMNYLLLFCTIWLSNG